MLFEYLGTGAAEGFPAVFCDCEACREARLLKGKNIRTRSQALIDGELLIDFPSDTYAHALCHGVRLDRVRFLLITHSHSDHFAPEDLEFRGMAFAPGMENVPVDLYCSEAVIRRYREVNGGRVCAPIEKALRLHAVRAYETFSAGDYTITPLPARHMATEECFIYVVEKAGKCLLYGNDTGFLYEEVFEYIERAKIVFDFVSLDCTLVDNPVSDTGTHMGFDQVNRVLNRFFSIGAVTEHTRKYVTHFSHNGRPLQDVLERRAQSFGLSVAYDGEKIMI